MGSQLKPVWFPILSLLGNISCAKIDMFSFSFVIVHVSSTTGPILCGKPILRSTVPSYCPTHFQKAEKHMVRALKKAGLNVSSTSKPAPKLHVIVAEFVHQIQHKRRAAQKVNLEKAEVKEESNS